MGEKFGTGDIISMCYNPYHKTLPFAKNDKEQGVIEDVISGKDLEYRLCVFLGGGSLAKSWIELL